MGGDDGQHSHREGDVGGGRDGPAADRALAVDGERDEDGGRYHHAADGGAMGRTAARVAQVAGDELTLEFEPDNEEEDGQQAVRGPAAQAQVQVQAEPVGADVEGRQIVIGRRPR